MAGRLRDTLRSGTATLGRLVGIGAPVAEPVTVSYVVAMRMNSMVGIFPTTNLKHDVDLIIQALPEAKVAYVLAVSCDPQMVASLAHGNLTHEALGNGWFNATAEEAEAAIEAAVKAYTGADVTHSTNEEIIAQARKA